LVVERAGDYVGSSATRKETIAREIAVRDHIESGLICVLTCVEPCYSFEVGPNRQQKRLELRYGPSRCRHDSFYVLDPQLFPEYPIPYYWSVAESEWATDVLFRSPEALAAVYPNLVRHSLLNIHSADVMRFLGRRMA